jgi:ubiquinone/menaquinone biosynthesis C-methylase UbiE
MSNQKERYYSDTGIVRDYERRRFERGGGRYVAELERFTVRGLLHQLDLKAGDIALDCPTGTGRFLQLLRELELQTLAVDISPAMLELARRIPGVHPLHASAEALPIDRGSVKVWLMSRFAFHFADLRGFFLEASRVLEPGGSLIFDVYHWTPRQWIPGKQQFLGGRVHVHSQARLAQWLEELGFQIIARRPVFLLAPYLYGFMPAFLPRWLDRASDAIAPRWKTKSYLLARKSLK